MKNLAIVIGIDKYKNNNDLIACKNDAKDMYEIIKESKKYDDIVYFNGEYTNREILKKLEELKIKSKDEEIGEIFFYFSGHGFSENNELFYVTTNTENNKINTTSLKNSEIDALFRDLNPNLYVKVIDSCQSGISYIKDIDEGILFEKAMNETKKEFKKCFFMFSSLRNQYSYVMEDNKRSFFTNSFIEALIYYKDQENVKYSEISNYMADYFRDKEKQTPFFITQTDMLDEFVKYNKELIVLLSNINNDKDKENIDENKEVKEDIKSKIIEKLSMCATKEEAKIFTDTIIKLFSQCSIEKSILNEYFNESKEMNNEINKIPKKKIIANWIYENKRELGLFAKTKLEEERKPKLYPLFNLSMSIYGEEKESTYEFEITEKEICSNIKIIITPKELGLEKYELNLVLIPSFSKIYVFQTFVKNIPITWGEYEYDNMNEWKMKEFCIKKDMEEIKNFVEETFNNFIEYCTSQLNELLK